MHRVLSRGWRDKEPKEVSWLPFPGGPRVDPYRPVRLPWSAAHDHDWCHGTGTCLLQDICVPTAAACSAPRTAPSPTAPGKDSERGRREGRQGEGLLKVTGIWGLHKYMESGRCKKRGSRKHFQSLSLFPFSL